VLAGTVESVFTIENRMIEKWTDLSSHLQQNEVESTAPTRLHCGGSTDHRLTGLLCRLWRPVTTNITIDLLARVTLSPFKTGRVRVSIDKVGNEEFTAPDLPFTGPFALIAALVCYFGVHGLAIDVATDFPFESGLGGSGAVAIALIGALFAALNRTAPTLRDYPRLVQIAHNVEDSLFRNTGMQDQAAALYGGANRWEWQYDDRLRFKRQVLLADPAPLSDHILVAYAGRPHYETRSGSRLLDRFRETTSIDLLVKISEEARKFAAAIKRGNYMAAGASLAAEHHLRSTLLPIVRKEDLDLIDMAVSENCGVSVAGSGGGGCIWAIGEKQNIASLKDRWSGALASRRSGRLLPIKTTNQGLRVSITRELIPEVAA